MLQIIFYQVFGTEVWIRKIKVLLYREQRIYIRKYVEFDLIEIVQKVVQETAKLRNKLHIRLLLAETVRVIEFSFKQQNK